MSMSAMPGSRKVMSGESERKNVKDTILGIAAFCSWTLVISVVHSIRYVFLKRQLKLVYAEHKEEIHEAIRANRLRFSAFLIEPQETGDDVIDVLLFKLHRSVMWSEVWMILYILSVVSLSLFFLCIRR